jgi:hypothetical protein
MGAFLAATALAAGGLVAGAPLPELRGEYLTKEKAVLPRDSQGKVALVALGFTYASRHAVEAWTERFREVYGEDHRATWYSVPMIGGAARLARPFIDGGMRRSTPEAGRRHVITVYGGTAAWKKMVGFRALDDAYLLLLDPEGRVRRTHQGPFDESRFDELRRDVDALLGEAAGLSAGGAAPRP